MSGRDRHAVLDVLRGFTILSVVAYHFHADTAGPPGRAASAGVAWAALSSGRFGDAVEALGRAVVGLSGFRLDLLLFVTGIVLSLGTPTNASAFLKRRARAILPDYVAGTLCAALLIAALAALRTWLGDRPFSLELHEGTLLGRTVYPFHWTDVLRSLSIVGRLESPRAMQVVAPSLWYLVLIAQLYLVFPWLRRLRDAAGPGWFLAACALITWTSRWAAFTWAPFGAFDANATIVLFLPPRLIAPALGMVAATVIGRWARPVRPAPVAWLAVPVTVLFVAATWIGASANVPHTTMGLVGPMLPFVLGVPAVWLLACVVAGMPLPARAMTWTGQHSLSLLVAQDFVRLVVGTLLARGIRLQDVFWWALPVYLVSAVLVTRAWEPVPEWCWSRGARLVRAAVRTESASAESVAAN